MSNAHNCTGKRTGRLNKSAGQCDAALDPVDPTDIILNLQSETYLGEKVELTGGFMGLRCRGNAKVGIKKLIISDVLNDAWQAWSGGIAIDRLEIDHTRPVRYTKANHPDCGHFFAKKLANDTSEDEAVFENLYIGSAKCNVVCHDLEVPEGEDPNDWQDKKNGFVWSETTRNIGVIFCPNGFEYISNSSAPYFIDSTNFTESEFGSEDHPLDPKLTSGKGIRIGGQGGTKIDPPASEDIVIHAMTGLNIELGEQVKAVTTIYVYEYDFENKPVLTKTIINGVAEDVAHELTPSELSAAKEFLGYHPDPEQPFREIADISIHCSATKAGNDIRVGDIRKWHLARGWSDVGYHFIVNIDGSVDVGRPVGAVPAAVKGKNRRMIAICYIGGLDGDTLEPTDTRTTAQKHSLLALLSDLKDNYPDAVIRGHRDYEGVKKACPCFDAQDEYAWIGADEAVYFDDESEVTPPEIKIKAKRKAEGIDKPVKGLGWSRIIQGAMTAIFGSGGLGWVGSTIQAKVDGLVKNAINDPIAALGDAQDATADVAKLVKGVDDIQAWFVGGAVLVVLVVFAAGYALYARVDDRNKGIN